MSPYWFLSFMFWTSLSNQTSQVQMVERQAGQMTLHEVKLLLHLLESSEVLLKQSALLGVYMGVHHQT